MMSNYQVVIVREAQDVKNLFPKKGADEEEGDEAGSGVTETDRDLFFEYLSNPLKSTLLVLCYKYKKADKRTKSGKILEKAGVFFDSKKIYEDKIAGWISAYVKNKGSGSMTRQQIFLVNTWEWNFPKSRMNWIS